jgi:hypothetical protein
MGPARCRHSGHILVALLILLALQAGLATVGLPDEPPGRADYDGDGDDHGLVPGRTVALDVVVTDSQVLLPFVVSRLGPNRDSVDVPRHALRPNLEPRAPPA